MMQNMQLMSGYRAQPEQINQALAAMSLNPYGGNYTVPQGGYSPRGGAGNYQQVANNAYTPVCAFFEKTPYFICCIFRLHLQVCWSHEHFPNTF